MQHGSVIRCDPPGRDDIDGDIVLRPFISERAANHPADICAADWYHPKNLG